MILFVAATVLIGGIEDAPPSAGETPAVVLSSAFRTEHATVDETPTVVLSTALRPERAPSDETLDGPLSTALQHPPAPSSIDDAPKTNRLEARSSGVVGSIRFPADGLGYGGSGLLGVESTLFFRRARTGLAADLFYYRGSNQEHVSQFVASEIATGPRFIVRVSGLAATFGGGPVFVSNRIASFYLGRQSRNVFGWWAGIGFSTRVMERGTMGLSIRHSDCVMTFDDGPYYNEQRRFRGGGTQFGVTAGLAFGEAPP